MSVRWLLVGLGLLTLGVGTAVCQPNSQPQGGDPAFTVLVFSKTAGFRHSSIDEGISAIQELGQEYGFGVEATENAAVFSDADLAPYRVIIFLNTTGDILDADQQAAMERFIQAGNGFVGVHSATDTEYDWEWYGQLVGSYFNGHPPVQAAEVRVEDPGHLSTSGLPDPWPRTDEWYNFDPDPSGSVNVLLTVDEASYSGGTMGAFHPIAWYHAFDNGRSWYTAMGHTEATYAEPLFRQHLLGGIRYAAGITLDPQAYLPLVQAP